MKKKKKKRIKWARLFILLLIIVLALNHRNIARKIYPAGYMDYIRTYSAMYQVDPYLVLSVIKAESNFNENAVSQKNAAGLMQVIEPTANWLAKRMGLTDFSYENIKDPKLNIQIGCYYISYLLDLYDGNTATALAAYNAGEGTVNKWLKNSEYSKDGKNLSFIPYPETRHYITKVTNNQKMYQTLYKIAPDTKE